MASKKKEMRNPLQEAFITLKEATAEEYVDILKNEWEEMISRGKEPIIEFDNGDYYYIEPDWENKKFYAGHAFNAGIRREIEMQMDPDMNLDEHIAELFDAIVDLDPSLIVDDDWNDPDTEMEFVNIGESKKLKEDRGVPTKLPIKVYMDFINYLGDVNESTLIAAFLNRGWAKDFIEFAKQSEDKLTKIRVEEN